MLATLAAALLFAVPADDLTCAVNNNDSATGLYSEYAGLKVNFCCAGCVPQFTKEPAKFLKQSAENKVTVAESFFDVTTGKKIDAKKAKAHADFQGVRYYFASEAGLATFNANKEKFTKAPKMESLVCAVMKEPIASYSKADSYVDYEGVRYYTCCAGCAAPLAKEPAKYAKNVKPTEPKVFEVKK